MKIKTAELTGAALDWAAAKAKFTDKVMTDSDREAWASVERQHWNERDVITEGA